VASYNKCVLMGNLTKDPELHHTESDTAICNFDIAVNNPTREDEVLFIRCVAFGKLADVANKYLSKGSGVLVDGRLVLESWTSTEGDKRSQIKLYVSTLQFVGSKVTSSNNEEVESVDI